MHYLLRRFLIALGLVFVGNLANAQAQRPDALVVTHTETAYVLQVPASRLQMTIPETGLKQEALDIGGSTSNPRYYNFSDPSRGLIISGWFEPASRFAGLTTFWENEQASWKKHGLPEAQNVSFETIGNWQAIFYDLTLPVVSNHHIRAHLIQAGTWIDLHISVTGNGADSPNRMTLRALLKSISVSEKPGS